MIMDTFKNERWLIPFKKFSRIRVKVTIKLLFEINYFVVTGV